MDIDAEIYNNLISKPYKTTTKLALQLTDTGNKVHIDWTLGTFSLLTNYLFARIAYDSGIFLGMYELKLQ